MTTRREIRRHIGQLTFVGFDGHAVPRELEALLHEFDIGGVTLFSRNVDTPEQVAELSRELESHARDLPPWVSVDQEGGRVRRLPPPFTEWPPMMALGRSGDTQLAERFARALAEELTAVGVSLNFAPVLDVQSNPANAVIGDRALSDSAEMVARLGSGIIRTLQAGGVAACGKHFPGHGDTAVDSHSDLPVIEHPRERLDAVELVPFRAAIEAGVASIMTAHLLIPALDEERPATLSPAVVHDLLRTQLHFDGLVVSDDLEMGAIARRFALEQAAGQAIAAGCDAVLLCTPSQERQALVLEALIHGVEDGTLSEMRVADALARQRRVKERFLGRRGGRPPAVSTAVRTLVDRPDHRVVAEEMARFL